MVGEADVTIRYAFLPTESSIREGAQKVIKTFNEKAAKQKWGSGIYSQAYHKRINEVMKSSVGKIGNEYKNTTDSIINLLRATQQKTSLQTKLLSGMKLLEGKGITGGVGGGEEGGGGAIGGIMGGIAGGGAGAALAAIVGLLTVISVSMMLISAFFDAVGPIIKVVMKMFSAMILILLMPFLKRGLPVLFDLLKWMISMSKGLADFADSFMTYIEKLLGKAMGGDIGAIFELLVGPLGMLVIFLGKELVKFLAAVDWKAIVDAVIPMLQNAFSVVMDFINTIGEAVFGKGMWLQIVSAVNLIYEIFSKDGVWNVIKETIDWLGENIFGKEMWETLKSDITTAINGIIITLGSLSSAIQTITKGITDFWNNVVVPNSFGFLSRISTAPTLFGGFASKSNFGYDESGKIGFLGGGSFGGGSTSKGTTTPGTGSGLAIANDFISRPGGGMMPFSPDDTIIGVKDTGKLGGTNITNNLYVSSGVDKKEFRKLLTEFGRQQGRELRTRTSYYGG